MELTDKQRKAIFALLSGATITDTADAADVSRQTVYDWLAEPSFRQELERLRALRDLETLELLRAATIAAAHRLLNLVQDSTTSPPDFLRAAALLFRRLPLPIAEEASKSQAFQFLQELQSCLPNELWKQVVLHLENAQNAHKDPGSVLRGSLDLRSLFGTSWVPGRSLVEESEERELEWDALDKT
jgi:hypothetical protein